MAISASTVFEVRTTGSDTACSGGFVTGASGTDYSQQNAAQYSLSGLTSVGAGSIILTASASADMVGNLILVTAGTNFTLSVFQITAVSVGVSITVSTNNAGTAVTTGVGAAGTAVIGGAFASPGFLGAQITGGNVAYIKSGTYSITSASTNIAGGCFSNANNAITLEGYGVTRGDFGTQPLLQASGISTFVLIIATGADARLSNLILDGQSLTSSKATTIGPGAAYKCLVKNMTNGAFAGSNGGFIAIACQATGCSTVVPFAVGTAFACEAYANTVSGFSTMSCFSCLSYGNTGASSVGFTDNGASNITFVNCDAYGNGSHGFVLGAQNGRSINCIAEGNAGWGFSNSGSFVFVINCGTYNNTLGSVQVLSPVAVLGTIVNTTGSFFVNAASSNFALNNTVNQGALARAAAYPGVFPRGLTTGYLDIGAAQHQDPAGGTVSYPLFD